MQSIVPPTEYNPNDHTEEEILGTLTGEGGIRRFSFRYVLMDAGNAPISQLSNVLSGSVEQNWLADIKRKGKFQIRDTGEIDYLSNRIQPWVRVALPPFGPQDYAEWPQGVFLLASPLRGSDSFRVVTRDVQGYDPLLVYVGDKVEDRYSVVQGTKYTDAVSTLLGSVPKNIVQSSLTLPTTKEWEPGTAKISIINELLNAVNYESLSFDENGNAVVSPYMSPQDRPVEYVYADDDKSLIIPDAEQELDLFDIPNKWVLGVSDPDRSPFTAVYTNTDPASPTSTVRRQRTITDFRTEQDAVDQTTLNAKVKRLAFEASQVYEAVEFNTGLLPFHSGNDVYHIRYDVLAIDAKYSEHTWSLSLRAGSSMQHRARRIVQI